MRCLVIEDEADTARYISNGLREAGHTPTLVRDGVSICRAEFLVARVRARLKKSKHDALDDPEQVEGAAREAVDASHCHHVAAGEAVEHAEKLAPVGWILN